MSKGDGRTAVLAALLTVALSGAGTTQDGAFTDEALVDDPYDGDDVVNTPGWEQDPSVTEDGLEMYFVSDRHAPGLTRFGLYVAWRSAASEPWEAVRALEELNNYPGTARTPSISANGMTLYFASQHEDGEGAQDIWVSRRDARWNDDGNPVPFVEAEPLREVNTAVGESGPDISKNELELFFHRNDPVDLWVARRRTTEDPFDEPTKEPFVEVNSSYGERHPSVSGDGLTLFFSSNDRPAPGVRLSNVWVTHRANSEARFGPPEVVGFPVSTSGDWEVYPEISCDWPADGALLYFVRGPVAAAHIRTAAWHPTRFVRGECNDDNRVDISDAVCLLNWLFLGGPPPACVAGTNVNGEDDVDISDATYLLNYLFLGGPPPVEPFPDCGPASTVDETLACETTPTVCVP